MKLNDSAIAQLVKLIQMAMLTGTDIVDHLRMLELEKRDDDTLHVDANYLDAFNSSIEKMLKNSEEQQDLQGD
jgi:hypothetical protein